VFSSKLQLRKKIQIETLLPDELERFPWAGHIGTQLLSKVLPIIHSSSSTLLFTNTRAQSEIWYQKLIETDPSLAGLIALHHGSLSQEIRQWVEQVLHEGKLKAVVCTSSLDLGVDFRPVDTVIQIGSPKGIARFMQRAGRSGHHPGAVSKIYYLPANSLEIIEGPAIRNAISEQFIEQRQCFIRSFDVLIQYLCTLACGEGFRHEEIYREVKATHCFSSITDEEWLWCLTFITKGSMTLDAYDEFRKVVIEDGLYKITNRGIAQRHRLSIGTIVSDVMMNVKFMAGKRLGSIEEWFVTKLNSGDSFWFAGRCLELISIKHMDVIVKPAKKNKGITPSWMGGRMPLSSELSVFIRNQFTGYQAGRNKESEVNFLEPLFALQAERSHVPKHDELLIEYLKLRNGYHLLVYPFEGRFVHEGMASILAGRIARKQAFTFSIAMNDYGFELLSDQPIPLEQIDWKEMFSSYQLKEDIFNTLNTTEMAARRFRDIASIAGLVFNGYPGKQLKTKHLQANSQLFFKVFEGMEKDNLLLREAYDEVLDFQLEWSRLLGAFQRIEKSKIILKIPEKISPFSFSLLVDGLRQQYTNEDLDQRIQRMLEQATR
jgi:ATP-dependent helicase Lhr and Lhr-like helicase